MESMTAPDAHIAKDGLPVCVYVCTVKVRDRITSMHKINILTVNTPKVRLDCISMSHHTSLAMPMSIDNRAFDQNIFVCSVHSWTATLLGLRCGCCSGGNCRSETWPRCRCLPLHVCGRVNGLRCYIDLNA